MPSELTQKIDMALRQKKLTAFRFPGCVRAGKTALCSLLLPLKLKALALSLVRRRSGIQPCRAEGAEAQGGQGRATRRGEAGESTGVAERPAALTSARSAGSFRLFGRGFLNGRKTRQGGSDYEESPIVQGKKRGSCANLEVFCPWLRERSNFRFGSRRRPKRS